MAQLCWIKMALVHWSLQQNMQPACTRVAVTSQRSCRRSIKSTWDLSAINSILSLKGIVILIISMRPIFSIFYLLLHPLNFARCTKNKTCAELKIMAIFAAYGQREFQYIFNGVVIEPTSNTYFELCMWICKIQHLAYNACIHGTHGMHRCLQWCWRFQL